MFFVLISKYKYSTDVEGLIVIHYILLFVVYAFVEYVDDLSFTGAPVVKVVHHSCFYNGLCRQ